MTFTNENTILPPVRAQRSPIADRVAAVITRKAREAGVSDAAYFRQIMDGKAPRITPAEAGIVQKGKAIG